MLTEPVVSSFSVSVFDRLSLNKFILTIIIIIIIISQIWLGFAWGVMYCMLECVTIPQLDFSKSYLFLFFNLPDRYQVFSNSSIILISHRLAAFMQLWCKFFFPSNSILVLDFLTCFCW